jgi:hypothetical protein
VVAGLAVVAAVLGGTSMAGAGHIDRGEGHGSEVAILFPPPVMFPINTADCRFSMRYSIEVKGNPNKEYSVRVDSAHLGVNDVVIASGLTKANNGFTLGPSGAFVHPEDNHSVDFTLELVDPRGSVVATSITRQIVSDCRE